MALPDVPNYAMCALEKHKGNKGLFGLLQKAYVEARYAETYPIRREEVKTIGG